MTVSIQAQNLARAVHTVLTDNLAVQAELGQPPRLYDASPEDPIYPYLTYGPMRSVDVGADGGPLSRHQMTLHIWSRYGGRSEVFGALSQIERALTPLDLTATGQAAVRRVNVIFADVLRATDGRTLHGLLRVSFTLETLDEEAL